MSDNDKVDLLDAALEEIRYTLDSINSRPPEMLSYQISNAPQDFVITDQFNSNFINKIEDSAIGESDYLVLTGANGGYSPSNVIISLNADSNITELKASGPIQIEAQASSSGISTRYEVSSVSGDVFIDTAVLYSSIEFNPMGLFVDSLLI